MQCNIGSNIYPGRYTYRSSTLVSLQSTVTKMALSGILLHQHIVILFLVENISAADIYGWLCDVCGVAFVGASTVRQQVNHFKDRNTDIADQPCCGQPRITITESNKQRVDLFITENQMVIVKLQHNLAQDTCHSRDDADSCDTE
jgi:hypothetical protein